MGSGPPLTDEERQFCLHAAFLAGAGEFTLWSAGSWLVAQRGWKAGALAAAAAFALHVLLRGPLSRRGARRLVSCAALLVGGAAAAAGLFLLRGHQAPDALRILPLVGAAPLGFLAAAAAAEHVELEKRSRAFAMIDIAQTLGVALGLVQGAASREIALGAAVIAAAVALPSALVVGRPAEDGCSHAFAIGQSALAMRQRSFWPALMAALIGGAALMRLAGPGFWWPLAFAALAVGMRVGARVGERLGERTNLLVAVVGLLLFAWIRSRGVSVGLCAGLQWASAGALLTGLAAAPASSSAEMLRAPASAVLWSALALGAALMAVT